MLRCDRPKYDVVISGAGPAGSIAASILGSKGFQVLLVDSAVFPREKVCGDLIVPSVFSILKRLGISDQNIREQAYPVHHIHLHGPFGTMVPIQFDFGTELTDIMVIKRRLLDMYLLDVAESTGVVRCTGRVTGIENAEKWVRIRIRQGKQYRRYTARVVIGADGVSSIVARQMKQKTWKHQAIAVRGYIEGISLHPHTIETHFISELYPGYGWIFPTGADSANVGLGCDVRYYKKFGRPFKRILQRFLQRASIKKRLHKQFSIHHIDTFPINLGPPQWDHLVGDRYIIIGDAAGLANAMTGGGIANAMYSGMIAGEVASKNITEGSLSRQYLREYVKELYTVLHQELWLSQKLSRVISLSPYIAEHLMRCAQKNRWTYHIINQLYADIQIEQIRHASDGVIRVKILK